MDSLKQKRSEAWNYFTPIYADFVKCNLCNQKSSYKSPVSNLKKNLQNRHPVTSAARISTAHIYEANRLF
jgi:hypothetical protein